MKLLSIAVPCYNSQEYMRNCIDSLLEGGDLVEIVIVDEGGSDLVSAVLDPIEHKKQKRRQMYEQTGSSNCGQA